MINDALSNQVLCFGQGISGSNAAGQVRQISRVAVAAFLDYNGVSDKSFTSSKRQSTASRFIFFRCSQSSASVQML